MAYFWDICFFANLGVGVVRLVFHHTGISEQVKLNASLRSNAAIKTELRRASLYFGSVVRQ